MSLPRLWAIARLDLLHNLQRPLTWIWVVIVFFCALGFAGGNLTIQAGDSATGGLQAFITSPFHIAMELTLLGGILYTFFVAVLGGMGVIRDEEFQIEPVLHSTPLRPSEYVWGKYLGAVVTSFVILALQVGLGAFFKYAITSEARPELIGGFSAYDFLQPALLFSVPLILFTSGIAFVIGARTRRPVLVNMFPLILMLVCAFFLWSWSPVWLESGWNRFLMMIDPTGYRWLNETWLKVDKGVEFYNTSVIPVDGAFFASRIGLAAFGLGAVMYSQRYLAKALSGPHASSKDLARVGTEPAKKKNLATALPLADLQMSSRRPRFISSVWEIARLELSILRGHPGVWLFLPLLVLNAIGDAASAVGALDTRMLMTPGKLAVGSLFELTFTLCLMLMFFTLEALRREESTRMNGIAFSTPTKTRAMVVGKLLATSVLGIVSMTAVMAASLVMLLVQGTVPVDLVPFGIVYGLFLLPVILFFNALVTALYVLTRNRFATFAISLGLIIMLAINLVKGELSWVGNWSLAGALHWTDMNPFEMDQKALLFNRAMVLSAMAFLIAFALRIYPRRQFDATRVVLRLRPRALLGTALRLLPFAILPIGFGVALQKGINAGQDGVRAEKWAKDYWRKNQRTWLGAPKPDISRAEVAVTLQPSNRWLQSSGIFELSNPHEDPMKEIALTGGPHWQNVAWTLNGESFEPRDQLGLYVFGLPDALQTGEICEIGFEFDGKLSANFTKNGGGASEFILEGGIVLTSFSPSFVPIVGFEDGIGITKENQSDAREFDDDHYLGQIGSLFGPSMPFPVKVTITAPEKFTMNSVGVQTEKSTLDGLTTVTWESDQPIRFFNIVGGQWDVRRGNGTAVFHHPSHTYNLDEMIQALDGAREFYSEWFHPFPWQELRLSEFPAYASYAQGFPTNITFSEEIGFLTKDDAKRSAAFMITAHEAAHQWWGSILIPGEGPGGNLLAEGTSDFSTLLLIEKIKGIEQRIVFCTLAEQQYNNGRVVDSERELVKIDGSKDGDSVITYSKMAWVCWMMMTHLGREQMMEGLHTFFDRYSESRDHPLLQDFVAHFREHADNPGAYDAFVQQWFYEVVLPEYKLEDATLTELPEGNHLVTVTVKNVGTGRMPIEVSAERGTRFQAAAAEEDNPFMESRTTVILEAGESKEVTIKCDFEPEVIRMDPDALVLQRSRKQAVAEL